MLHVYLNIVRSRSNAACVFEYCQERAIAKDLIDKGYMVKQACHDMYAIKKYNQYRV